MAAERTDSQAELLAAAKAANAYYKVQMQKSLTEDRFLHGLESTDEAMMYSVIAKRGTAAFIAGVQDKAAKAGVAYAKLQPMIVALCAELDRLPSATETDREQKAVKCIQGMRLIGRKLRGG